MLPQIASFIGNNAAARNLTASVIPPDYSKVSTGNLITTEPYGDELFPKKPRQWWDTTYDKLPAIQTDYPFSAAQNSVGGQINNIWQFQSSAYSPMNMLTQQMNITFTPYSFIDGNQAPFTWGEFFSFYTYYFNEGEEYIAGSTGGFSSTGVYNDQKSLYWNCCQTGMYPLFTTFEVKTGIQPISVSYMTQDRALLFKAGAFLLRKIEHDYSIIVPWLSLWTMNDNISVEKVDTSKNWGSFTNFASCRYLYDFFTGAFPPPWTFRSPMWTVDRLEQKFPAAWLKARAIWIKSLLNTYLVSAGTPRKWDVTDTTALPAVNLDLTFPISLFQPLFEQPAHFLNVNDQFRFDQKYNPDKIVVLGWGTQFVITANANPIGQYSAIVSNFLQPSLQLMEQLAKEYATSSQYLNYYSWKQSQEYIIKAGQPTFDFQLVAGDAIPDYIVVTICNPVPPANSYKLFDYQYNLVNSDKLSWQNHFSFNDNQIPIRFSNLVITAYGIKTVYYSDEGYLWTADDNTKATDYAYDYQKRQFWNSPVDIQDKGNLNYQYGYQTAFVISTDPGYYQKEDGDLFKHQDRGSTELKLSGTIVRAPMYSQNPKVVPFQTLPYDVTLRCYLVYPTVMEITPTKTINTTVPPSFPFLNNFGRISNLKPNSLTPVGGIQTN